MMKKVDAILACRVNGTRLYGKPLQYIDIKNEITILENLVKYINTSKNINSICLAISEEKENYGFIELAEKNNWKYVIGDKHDVLARVLKGAEKFNTDIIFRNTTENPFMYFEKMDELISNHINNNYDYSTYSDLPDGTSFELINADALRLSHKNGSSKHRSELVTSYIFDNKDRFSINTELPPKKIQRSDVRLTVDYPEDLVFCRGVYNALKGQENLVKVTDIVDLWDKNKEARKDVETIGIDWGHGRIWK